MELVDRSIGCLLGGAIGDALGAEIEFASIDMIRMQFGADGFTDPVEMLRITDDTQMTLFSAEAIVRASNRVIEQGIEGETVGRWPRSVVDASRDAYLRWYATQGGHPDKRVLDGWLYAQKELHHRRAPGNTCLAALRAGGEGTIRNPPNNSKGCGTVMRVAPYGLVCGSDSFALAAETSALTHGHPSGYLAGGACALMIATTVAAQSLEDAIDVALVELAEWPAGDETALALRHARQLAEDHPVATPELVERLGGGWVAEEALAIATYCALTADGDFAAGVRAAINHSGDSDSTGAICGNLLGALLGPAAIPGRWADRLVERSLVRTVATDLATQHATDPPTVIDPDRYPPT